MKTFNFYLIFLFCLFAYGCKESGTTLSPASHTSNAPNAFSNTSNIIKPYESCNLSDLGISQSLGSPSTIAEAIELINALPRPLDIPCLISSLNRPLNINITDSRLSVQQAISDKSPRIFIFNSTLVIAITMDGEASYLVEFSEYTGSINTIKGELQFPIQSGTVSLRAPFERIKNGNRTSCSACHRNETISTSIYPGIVYQSISLKPESLSKVNISVLVSEVSKCHSVTPNYRCNLLYSVFNQGNVVQVEFPGGTPTFLESLRF